MTLPRLIRRFCSSSVPSLSSFCNDLVARGLVENPYPATLISDDFLQRLPNVLYAGFDPTAESLHVGNLVIVNALLRAGLNGCKPIALIGGATALIGDPSGKTTDRVQLDEDVVLANAEKLRGSIQALRANASELYGKPIDLLLVDNASWYRNMPMIDFLKLARKFRVGQMLRMGHIKNRMKDDSEGISFTEFSYQILQSYDWLRLAEKHNCMFQIGGSDQLGHLDLGAHYIKNMIDQRAAGICMPLITDVFGNKIGKSTAEKGGSVWLNAEMTSPYALYQYFRQLHDDSAEKLLPYFSLKPLSEIQQIIANHRSNLGKWVAQTALAEEIVQIVHGEEGLKTATRCSNVLFYGSLDDFAALDLKTLLELFGEASTFSIPRSVSTYGELADATRRDKVKGSALMTKGAFRVNGERRLNPDEKIDFDSVALNHNVSIIAWGKRKFFLIKWI